MPGLAVGADELFHELFLRDLRNAGRDQLSGFHFVNMTVPEFFLFLGQPCEQFLRDDVLDAHDFRVVIVAVEDHTLNQVFIEMAAVVMRFHLTLHVAAVEVKAIEIGIQCGEWSLALQEICADLERLCLGPFVGTRCADGR